MEGASHAPHTPSVARDLFHAVAFGALSLALGFIQFRVPGVEGVQVDLREVGLLIAAMHLRRWPLMLVVGAMTSLATPPDGSMTSTMVFHMVGAPVAWFAHRALVRAVPHRAALGVAWGAFVIVWYVALILPLLALTYWFFGLIAADHIVPTYLRVLRAAPYEFFTTATTTALYLMQGQELVRRRRTERALRASEHWIASILDAVPVGVVVLDDGRITFANRALGALAGAQPDALIGRHVSELIDHHEPPPVLLARLGRDRDGDAADAMVLQRSDGARLDVEVRAAHLRASDPGGDRSSDRLRDELALTIIDVTERLRLERQLRQAQKMDALGHLASGVAHDFNNMLTAIGLNEELIRTRLGDGHAVDRELADLREAVAHASGVVRQLLSFAREQPSEPRPIDLGALLARVVPMVHSLIGRSFGLTLEVAPDLPPIFADPTVVEQVVVNLVINARDAIEERPDGPRQIRVVVDRAPDRCADGREALLLAIADTGIGMDDATRARIFEPFFTTKAAGRGTGLGLATVYGAVLQHGATLDVSSEPGVGTTFRIGWPLAA